MGEGGLKGMAFSTAFPSVGNSKSFSEGTGLK
jgi:hypothetical protein